MAIVPRRVLIVDDSAFARKVMRQVLRTSENLEVVDTARDGLEALEKIAELQPDVVTLDLVMPHLDGIGVLQALPKGLPRVVVVSTSDKESELGIRALELGAVDIVHKPTALATDQLYELSNELIRKVESAASAKVSPQPLIAPVPLTSPIEPAVITDVRVLVIGTSTGGPQALSQIIPMFPADFPVPIAVVVHIPAGYTQALAQRLDRISALHVVEAHDGIELRAGTAVIARAGMHLRLECQGQRVFGRLEVTPLTSPYRPSVDILFQSAAAELGAGVLGIVLTGMGDDGVVGARAIRSAGGKVLTEAESSCVIYGMPRSVQEAGAADAEAPLPEMMAAIIRLL